MKLAQILSYKPFVVPKGYRTLFFNDKPIRLNLPELTFYQDLYRNLYVWILKDNKAYYVPLPNLYDNGEVCLIKRSNYIKENIDTFFNSSFVLEFFDHIYHIQHMLLVKYIRKYHAIVENIQSQAELIKKSQIQPKVDSIFKQNVLQFYFDNLIPVSPKSLELMETDDPNDNYYVE